MQNKHLTNDKRTQTQKQSRERQQTKQKDLKVTADGKALVGNF